MRVPVKPRSTVWSAGTPVALLQGRYFTGNQGRTYDVSPDGRRFLMIKEAGADQADARPQIIVVQHWFEELSGWCRRAERSGSTPAGRGVEPLELGRQRCRPRDRAGSRP